MIIDDEVDVQVVVPNSHKPCINSKFIADTEAALFLLYDF